MDATGVGRAATVRVAVSAVEDALGHGRGPGTGSLNVST